MMNSTNDEFGENPFRSSSVEGTDFFNSAPVPAQQVPMQQPQYQQAQQPQYQQAQQQPPQQQQFQPEFQPQGNGFAAPMPPHGNGFAAPSGGMETSSVQPQPSMQMQPQPQPSRGFWGTFFMIIDLNTYKSYFDVDAVDIGTRLKAVCLDFYKPEHFRNNVLGSQQQTNGLKGPDLYGPFWVTMTLIFLVGVTSNMHAYLHRSNDVEVFEYDINHLLHAASIFSTFSFGVPALFWVTAKCMNIEALSLAEWLCLYGYSMVPFIPAVLLCVIPLSFLSVLFLLGASLVSCSLIVRNVAAPMLSTDVGQKKAPPLIFAILVSHVAFFFVVKIMFFTQKKHPAEE